ncbi:MAG: Unknown protein [uncultured Aureispira sp.]|uniref:EGF-like domain-containing protein n=1 Tax=uncultured Aureispira sp. TaxID=1331704 RepID=A0A6S6T1W1_9BACT|nr:MAG: Unknown protein [uncultured Aureispira sp.]
MKQSILFLILSLGLTFSSCDNASCGDILCGDNASCVQGTCTCLQGYEKNNNDLCVSTLIRARSNFTGTWAVSENCSSAIYSFISTIVKHPTEDDQLILSNFYDSYNSVYAVMTSETTFEIPLQLHNSNRVTITGEGMYENPGSVIINYNIELVDGTSSDYCTAFYTK